METKYTQLNNQFEQFNLSNSSVIFTGCGSARDRLITSSYELYPIHLCYYILQDFRKTLIAIQFLTVSIITPDF